MSSIFSKNSKKEKTAPSSSSRQPKWVVWVASAVVVALLGVGAYFVVKAQQTKAAAATTSTLQTATARTGNLVLQASGSGYLVAATEANIAFEIDGKLSELDVSLGDKVEKANCWPNWMTTPCNINWKRPNWLCLS
jgi:multidrug efflux pump subunit AcrA (membrane-fusion protein)